MNYTVTEGNYLRFGLQSVKDGVIFTFAGEKEDVCEVILYDRSLKGSGCILQRGSQICLHTWVEGRSFII